jgi:hypothetical protein
MPRDSSLRRTSFASTLVLLGFVACSNSQPANPTDAGSDATQGPNDSGSDGAWATCASPGQATPGPAGTRCKGDDSGPDTVQPTSATSCHPDAGDDGGTSDCPYGDTVYGHESYDDDCKYHVTWASTPICESAAGVLFTVVVTNATDNSPLVNAHTLSEAFTTTPGDASCDDQSTHPAPSGGVLTEDPPGTYSGRVVFDAPGQWTLRFHFHEECADIFPDSPHGHAAFHLTIP